jgi:hypothetical protein
MKYWLKMPYSGTWCHVDLVRDDVSEEHVATIFRVERIDEQGTALVIGWYEEWRILGCYAVWLL